MAGFGFGSVGFVGSLGGAAVVVAPVTNRAIKVSAFNVGRLQTVGTAFALGLNWLIELRVRNVSTGGTYLFNHYSANGDQFGIVHGFAANTYELYWPGSSVGLVRLAVPPITDGLFHLVRFTYDGATVRGFVDGTPGPTLAVANAGQTTETNALLYLAERPGNSPFTGDVDALRITAGAAVLADFTFNETSGPALNTGTMGDISFFGTNAGERVLLP